VRGLWRLSGLALLGALAACAASPEEKPKADAPLSIAIAQVGAKAGLSTIDGAGTVALRRETGLGFTTPGQVAQVFVNEGDRVRKGQLLAILDTTQVSAGLSAAQAELTRAQGELSRSAALFKQGWVTRPRLDSAQAAVEAASATVRTRRFAANTARIVAPSNGTILARNIDAAQIVGEGTPVIVIGDDSGGYVLRVPFNDRDIGKIGRGSPASVRLDGLGGESFTGSVIEIGGRSDRATGSFIVEIALPADPRLRSGLIGQASVTATAPLGPQQIIIPAGALLAARAGEGFVYVVADGDKRARLRKVTLAETTDGGVIVTSGINAGEWVAIASLDRLKDGQAVTPVKRIP
jgi:RND family efflux transporter MFP subunit